MILLGVVYCHVVMHNFRGSGMLADKGERIL